MKPMTEIQRRITVTSSLNEIFTKRAVERGEALLCSPHAPFSTAGLLDRYLNDDVNGFFLHIKKFSSLL
jgi:hypothetical protein